MGESTLKSLPNRIWQNERLSPLLSRISQLTFLLGLLIELTIVILDKSAYTIQHEGQWFRVTFVLFGISLLTTRHSLKEWIWLFLMGIMAVISYRATGRNEILRFVVFIWACVGKEMKKVLKGTFWYMAAGCAVLALLAVFGIAGEVSMTAVYRVEEETRYCFGMGHPNAFHCMMLAITWLGLYCYNEAIKWWGYILIGLAHFLLYLLTDSRSGFLLSVASLLLIIILKYKKTIQRKKWPYLVGIIILLASVAFSVWIAYYVAHYGLKLPQWIRRLDAILTGRISTLMSSNRWEGTVSTWSLWSAPENHYFFDLGIVRIFYWYGIIPAVIYFLAQCRLLWCSCKKKDYMLLALTVSITLYTVFEAHYVSVYLGRNYILFFLGMYLQDILGRKENGKWEEVKNG